MKLMLILIIVYGITMANSEVKGDGEQDLTNQPQDCTLSCPVNITIPDCGTLKMAPIYHPTCNCLVEYSCCPKTCLKPVSNCANGTFPIEELDCCHCPLIRCEECPKVELDDCTRSECEFIDYEKTKLGCDIPVCRTRCPEWEDIDCPKCYAAHTYINATLCGCEEQQCVRKTCSVPKKIDAADYPCHAIVSKTDDCGCSYSKPERGPYCKAMNKVSRERVCESDRLPDQCFRVEVKEKADECGCDTSECVLKEENVVDEYERRACPKNHHMTSGLTPCGRARDACTMCPEAKVEETNCDLNCSTIQVSTDFHGCQIKTCKKNPCPDCYSGYSYGEDLVEDACACKVCRELPEIVIQRRTSVENTAFHVDFNYYNKDGFRWENGDFWLGLQRIYRFTNSATTGMYQLVLSARRLDDGRWMQIVYDSFYIPGGNDYRILFGNVIEKHNTDIGDSDAKKFYNCQFSTYNYRHTAIASKYKGGWWFCPSDDHKICLNCDQRKTHLWMENGKTVKLRETQMSIRIKLGQV